MPLIGLDLGTTFIKGAVIDPDSYGIDHVRRIAFPAPLRSEHPLYKEYDPGVILGIVQTILNELLPLAGNCEGIVMCTQMHGMVMTTARGEARSTLTTWLDQRVLMPHPSGIGTYFDTLISRLTPACIRQLGGTELRVGLPIGNLFWLKERGELPPSDLYPAALCDYVIAALTGQPPVTEASNAQSHGAFNLESNAWHTELIDALDLQSVSWPEIHRTGEIIGYLPYQGQRIPVYTAIGDYQCALTGSLIREGELSINISTGSQVSLLRPHLEFGNFQTRPFFDGQYLITVTTIPAGRALNALVGLLTELTIAQGAQPADPWEYIIRQAEQIDSDSVQMRANLAFYASATGDRGAITDMRESEMTVGHLFRAAFANMADNYFACAARLSDDQIWHGIVFAGGLSQKIALLRRLIAERFDRPYRVCPSSEDTMLGLMAMGMAFTGRYPTVTQAIAALYQHYEGKD